MKIIVGNLVKIRQAKQEELSQQIKKEKENTPKYSTTIMKNTAKIKKKTEPKSASHAEKNQKS